ncbi:MAG: cob(I)yrinic acid a,c-diamide adenosyltransferase [Candidatus Micrarchaeota archaeon]
MAIYTRLGDKGDTVTLGGDKVHKDDPLIEAQGQIDELNAIIGVVVSFSGDACMTSSLQKVQKELFILGAELSAEKSRKRITLKHVEELESLIDGFEETLPALANFVLPGGCRAASLLHYARTVCRRCERRLAAPHREKKINEVALTYMNRLGDLLFTLARYANRKTRVDEIIWKG